MTCVACDPWPDPSSVEGCCTPPPDVPPAVLAAIWEGVVRMILSRRPCYQVCNWLVEVCRPCRCDLSCNPCGCCTNRVQMPWVCGQIVSVSLPDGTLLDPADWNFVGGYLWPSSCEWPCKVTVEVAVGDPPPAGLLLAAFQLWCKLAADCSTACGPPSNATSVTGPDGVTVSFRPWEDVVEAGLTGMGRMIDLLLLAHPCPDPAQQVRLWDPEDLQWVTVR